MEWVGKGEPRRGIVGVHYQWGLVGPMALVAFRGLSAA